MPEQDFEAAPEKEAAVAAHQRLLRIEANAKSLLGEPNASLWDTQGQDYTVRRGNITIRLRYPPTGPMHGNFGKDLHVAVERTLRENRRAGEQRGPDRPITLEIRFKRDPPGYYQVLVESNPVWEQNKPLLPGSHADVLSMLHLTADTVEREWVKVNEGRIKAHQEETRQRLASIGVMRENLEESELPAASAGDDNR